MYVMRCHASLQKNLLKIVTPVRLAIKTVLYYSKYCYFIPGNANVKGGQPKFSIYLDATVQATHHRSYELPTNTILGYACYEMVYDSAMGTFELVLPDETDAGKLESNTRHHHVFDKPDGQNGKMLVKPLDKSTPALPTLYQHCTSRYSFLL